jgi:carbonic anhydrase
MTHRMPRIAALTLLLAAATTALAENVGPTWNHDVSDPLEGPEVWGDIDEGFSRCGGISAPVGLRQSPIALDRRGAVTRWVAPLVFDYDDSTLEVENNGHVIEVPYEAGSKLRIGGDEYALRQFHFHAPSEHTLNGQRYPLEVHLVHADDEGRLAVVGVLLRKGWHGNSTVRRVFDIAPDSVGAVVDEHREINAADLLPVPNWHGRTVATRFYSYSGSLTTPPCSEGVRWYVLNDPVTVSADDVERMHELVARFPHYDGYDDNNRPLQLVNGRKVVKSGVR